MAVLVEYRCPAENRLFGKGAGAGEMQFACRDCAKKKRALGWHGMVIHVFGAGGVLIRTVEVASSPRPR